MNFWQEMKNSGKPILCLAPMADVTDAAFRFIISKYSKKLPKGIFWDRGGSKMSFGNFVTYTEFVSADGLVLAPEEGRKKLIKNLEFSEIERPIVAQFFTNKPEMMEKAAALAFELAFDGVDINMGCPDKKVEKQGAGATLIKDPKLARELIIAAKQGILRCHLRKSPQGGTLGIPVSVKTRLGYNKDELETWLPEILAENPAAVVIHARTRKEMSKAPARWERIKRAVEIRNKVSRLNLDTEKTLIIGNGDVEDVLDAYKKCAETGADGAMIGRGVFGKPWLLSNSYEWFNDKNDPAVIKKILEILLEHTKLFEEKFLPNAKEKSDRFKSFAVMKKHFKSYLASLRNAKEIRESLMKAKNTEDVEKIINNFLDLV